MAYKDSEELEVNERYSLGDYSFRIERTSVPGSTNDKIEAICTDKDGHNARKSIQVPSSTQLNGWCVEANETEASVYVLVKIPIPKAEYEIEGIPAPNGKTQDYIVPLYGEVTDGNIRMWAEYADVTHGYTKVSNQSIYYNDYESNEAYPVTMHFEIVPGSKNYVRWIRSYQDGDTKNSILYGFAWDDAGSEPEYEIKELLVARFAIDIEDAGGVGPEGGTGGGWTDPADYDEDWEEGDPTHTLYIEVKGALSGRHNDPIEDPSYSYIPADKDIVKYYGCGGDGGHGGGGGAGASTVVIYKFATNQANSKELTALARRHGYGSGGGKGGKGGDGCILVYY